MTSPLSCIGDSYDEGGPDNDMGNFEIQERGKRKADYALLKYGRRNGRLIDTGSRNAKP